MIVLGAAALALGIELTVRAARRPACSASAIGATAPELDLYAMGESTMEGQPYDGLSIPDLVSRAFDGEIHGRRIRVQNLAKRGQSIFPQVFALQDELRCRAGRAPGVLFIYSGHNDSGNPRAPSRLEKASRMLERRFETVRVALYYVEKKFPWTRARTLDSYRYYLARAIDLARESGLTPIVSTAASNLKDIDPRAPDDPAFLKLLDRGESLVASGRAKEAIRLFASGHDDPRTRAYLAYDLGLAHEKLGAYAEAKRWFQEAVDQDRSGNFHRATSRQNEAVRELARMRGIQIVDTAALFERKSPRGIPGDDLFADGHHPNIKGVILMANEFAAKTSLVFDNAPFRRYSESESPDRIFKSLGYPKERQARAMILSGNWLVAISAKEMRPRIRLRSARTRFLEALRLDPGNIAARFGLCLAEAGESGGFLRDKSNLEWMGKHGLFYGARAVHSPQLLLEFRTRLSGIETGSACRGFL